jgi:HK97 gp10 family phage protein
MAGVTKIEIRGIAQLNAKLTKVIRDGGSGLERGINMAAALVSGRAKALCPVDTGLLRASIHPSAARKKGDEITGGVITATEYAVYVEFGTGVRGNGSYPYPTKQNLAYDGEAKGQVAQPFLGRALHESEYDIDKLVLRAVRQSIQGAR